MASIFDSALNFVQEREEPVDFIDIFFDYETKKEDLGIFDDIVQSKQQKKKLSPLKQKNLSTSYINNSNSNSMQATIDYISNKSQSFVNQLSSKNQSTGRQFKQSKLLSPLKNGFQSPQGRLVNSLSTYQNNGSQSQKSIKQYNDALNSVMEQQQYFNQDFLHDYVSKEQQKQQQSFYGNLAQQNSEKSDLDDMYRNSLFKNNLNRLRLQQIEFYPNGPQKSKVFSNHQAQNYTHASHFNEQTPSQMMYDQFDQNHPYSLKSGNNFLKEHFNLQIKNVPDPRKKYIVRKVNKQANNSQTSSQQREERNTKFSQNQSQFTYNENQQLSTQTDDGNAFETVQKSVQGTRDQMIIKSLNPQLPKNNFFQTGFDFNSQNQAKNGFINLNNLMISINSPTIFFNKDQFFNQNFSPQTAPSQSRKDKVFQIKKFQPQTASSNPKSEYNKTFFKEQGSQSNVLVRQKLTKIKSDLLFNKQKQMQSQDNNFNNYLTNDPFKQQNKLKKQNIIQKPIKLEQIYPQNEMNNFIPYSLEQLIDNNPKVLPLYCLNFSRALEKRLLLNSLGI